MSIVVKAGAGLAAGVVAGALGLALLPRLEPNVVRPRNAVEKPQFVVASAVAPPTQPAATLAVATQTPVAKPTAPAAKPTAPVKSEPVAAAAPPAAPSPSPAVTPPAAASTPAAKVAATAPPSVIAEPVASNAAPPAKPLVVAHDDASASPNPTPAGHAPPADAAHWSVRGLVALARGDISSARLFLDRAAEAGDARAWVALADTYDPAMLAKLGVVFAPGDAQRARDCLVKAVAAGVVVPKDRLAALDQGDHSVR